jgi:hypothetical protein
VDDIMIMRPRLSPAETSEDDTREAGIRVAAQLLRWLANRSRCPDCGARAATEHTDGCEVASILLGKAEHIDELPDGAPFSLHADAANGCVVLTVHEPGEFALPPDLADDFAADMRNFAVEVRNGGRAL